MHKTSSIFLSIAFAVAGGVLIYLGNPAGGSEPTVPAFRDVEARPRVHEDRAHWNWLRRRNPKTGKLPKVTRAMEAAFARSLPQRKGDVVGKSGRAYEVRWTSLGPDNVGGRTRALTIDVRDPDVLISGGVSGGIWRSGDGGVSWSRVTRSDQPFGVTTIVQDTRAGHEDTWYAGLGESNGSGGAAWGSGLLKSIDNGFTWFRLESTIHDRDFFSVVRLAIDPSNMAQDEVYAATNFAILRSVDGGETWSRARPARGMADVAVASTGTVYATSEWFSCTNCDPNLRPIQRSEDGLTWTDITPETWNDWNRRVVLSIAASDEDIVYFFAETPFVGHCVTYLGRRCHELYRYQADSTGLSEGRWVNLTGGLTTNNGLKLRTQGSYDMVIAVAPDDPDVVYVGGVELLRSNDGFASSSSVTDLGAAHVDQHVLTFSPTDPNRIYAGSDGGIHTAVDSRLTGPRLAWTSLNSGFITTQFYSVAVNHDVAGSRLVVGGTQDNGSLVTQPTSGESWTEASGGDGAFVGIAWPQRSLYTSSQYGVLYRHSLTENGEIVPGTTTRIDPADVSGYSFINPFLIDPNDGDVIYVAQGRYMWRHNALSSIRVGSYRETAGWERVATLPRSLSAFGASRAEPQGRIYVADGSSIYRVDNARQGTIEPIDVTGPDFLGVINSIAVDPMNSNVVLVAFSNYDVPSLYSTTDGGDQWTPVGGNLEARWDSTRYPPALNSIRIVALGPTDRVYLAGGTSGLYSTTQLDGPNTIWSLDAVDEIGYAAVEMIDVRGGDGFVAIGTHGNGVFEADFDVQGENRAPTMIASLPDVEMVGGLDTLDVDLNATFVDPDGDSLEFFSTVEDTSVVMTTLAGYRATFVPMGVGTSTIVLGARDELGLEASASFSVTVPTFVGIDDEPDINASVATVGPAFPNPFVRTVSIPVKLTDPAHVVATIFGLDGSRIDQLLDDRLASGRHDIRWTPTDVSAGRYLYRIEVGRQADTGVVVLGY